MSDKQPGITHPLIRRISRTAFRIEMEIYAGEVLTSAEQADLYERIRATVNQAIADYDKAAKGGPENPMIPIEVRRGTELPQDGGMRSTFIRNRAEWPME